MPVLLRLFATFCIRFISPTYYIAVLYSPFFCTFLQMCSDNSLLTTLAVEDAAQRVRRWFTPVGSCICTRTRAELYRVSAPVHVSSIIHQCVCVCVFT